MENPLMFSTRTGPASELQKHPFLKQQSAILSLLEEMCRDYDELAQSGSYLTYRLATAKHCAQAKGILNVLAACDAYRYKDDIV